MYAGDEFARQLAQAADATPLASHMQLVVAAVPKPSGISLRRVRDDEFSAYLAAQVDLYGHELMAMGLSAEDAANRARQESKALLPEGPATPGHQLRMICDAAGDHVGSLWLAGESDRSFIYNIEVAEDARGQGLGTQALRAAASLTRDAGLPVMELNVFAENTGAHRLYAREGFRETDTTYKLSVR